MRKWGYIARGIGAAALAALLGGAALRADTIVLKNGRKITGSNIVEENGHVTYETPAGKLSIPASIVEKIIRDAPSANNIPVADRASELGIAAPDSLKPSADSADGAKAAVHDGSIDREYIAHLESTVRANSTPDGVAQVVAAEKAAALFELNHASLSEALLHYRTALEFAPDDLNVRLNSAYLHLRESEFSAALEDLDHARSAAPDSPDVAKLTGWAYYGLNRVEDAAKEWKRALALRPDPQVEEALAKAERDAQQEAGDREGVTSHFTLRYDGSAAPELAKQILNTLEREFSEISSALDYSPPEPIGVILYTNQAFMDITRAPAWAGAENDGRLRIPVEGIGSVNEEMARILKHELTHSFLTQKSRGRAPVWLQEGVAQYMEGKRCKSFAAQLSQAYEQHMEISLASYEGSWMNLPPSAVAEAYEWSLAVVEGIVAEGSLADITRLLDRLADGVAPEQAVRDVLHDSYDDLMQSTVGYLRKTYL